MVISTLLVSAAAIGAYMLFERPSYRMLGSLRQAELVRAYLLNPRLRHFARTLAAQDPKTDLIATLWDTNTGVLLSRRMYSQVTMEGLTRYRYKPGLKKLGFRTSASGLRWNMETEDTPMIRSALAGLDTTFIVTASYDSNGFRRVDPELTTACTTVRFSSGTPSRMDSGSRTLTPSSTSMATSYASDPVWRSARSTRA